MIKDLAEFLTCDYILYHGKVYKRILMGYKCAQGDELPENYGLYSVTFCLLENYLKGGIETFAHQLNFTETFNYNYWLKENIIKLKITCKLQLK